MVTIDIKNNDFLIFKKIPYIPRLVIASLLAIFGIIVQLFIPIQGIFPFEQTSVSPVTFTIGLVLLILAVLLLFPIRLIISEEPKLSTDSPIWKDATMKQLSDVFNAINTRQKKQKSNAAFFDLTKSKGRWIFLAAIVGVTLIYLLLLLAVNRLFFSTILFLIDFYILIVPLWFIIRIEYWEPDIMRKILFYYQFTKHEDLDEVEFITTPAIQLQRVIDPSSDDEIMLPINVRFMIDLNDPPSIFEELSIQVMVNKSVGGNKFPSLVCFLRIKNPSDWQPLKKKIAYADRIVKIQHIVEENGLHLFVLSKSPKVESPYHTSPKEATKIFKRALKMLNDFADSKYEFQEELSDDDEFQ
ncbi:MAG: hypothetical protein FK734_06390 [Asgard group archaeon]|nr:hypothetical protein [Asgard group archaeon]